MQEVVRYGVKSDVDISSLLKKDRKTLCFIVDSAGTIFRHAGINGEIDSSISNLNIVRGNGDVEAYFRRQLLGSALIYDNNVVIYVDPKHEEAFRDVVAKMGFKLEYTN